MKSRKERIAEFMANIDTLSFAKLRVACYVRQNNLPELNDISQVIIDIKQEFDERPESWIIDDIACEYNRIKDMSEHNLQIWANYRRNCNVDSPIAKGNGDFIEVKAEGIRVTVDGASINIDNNDFVTIYGDCSNGEDNWANISFAAMQKIVQIKEHWKEIKRLVE